MSAPWRENLAAEYSAAVDAVEPRHYDALRNQYGVPYAAIEMAGGFGVARVAPQGSGLYELDGEGEAAVVLPVYADHAPSRMNEVPAALPVDLVAWRPEKPSAWWLRSGEAWLLGAGALLDVQQLEGERAIVRQDNRTMRGTAPVPDAPALRLFSDPLQWLRSECAGAVVLNWALAACDLAAVEHIECESPALRALVRAALSRPPRLPVLSVASPAEGVAA